LSQLRIDQGTRHAASKGPGVGLAGDFIQLHAKMLLADGARAIVGSINLTPGSFDSRRELAIEVHEDEVVDRLHDIVHQDWENSRPLDLTDEGLLADLQDENEAESLGLSAGHGKHSKKS
jgi:cardiolipin synthase